MTAIEPLLRQPAAQALGWALLQFLWQGALLGLLTAVTLAALKRSAADVRYVIATIALSLMLTMPIVTAVQFWRAAAAVSAEASAVLTPASARGLAQAIDDASRADKGRLPVAGDPIVGDPRGALSRSTIEAWLPMFLMVWLAGVSLLTLRLLSGWVWIQRLKTHAAAAGDGWERMLGRLCRRLRIRRAVRVLESSLVEVPTVIGWIKPVILLPGSALAGLSPQQLEAILAHELAHIRRHDYLVNLVQTLVETLLFYHPAVWWLSHRIRVERENCCDDLAVSLCGDPYTYARALADLEERRAGCGHLAMAASGGSLLQRVRRLLGAPTTHAGRGPAWLAATAAISVMAIIVAGELGNDKIRAQQAATPQVVPATVAPPAAPLLRSTPVTTRRPGPSDRVVTPPGIATPAVATTAVPFEQKASAALAPVASTENAAAMPPALENRAIAALLPPAEPAASIGPATPVIAAAMHAIVSPAPVHESGQETGNYTWSHNGERLQVNYRGDVEFSDDDTDVKALSPGGYLKIRDGRWFGGRAVEFSADAAGKIERRYWVGRSERPFEPEGRQWLAQALPRFIRQSGMGARGRVARILKSGGTAGVLAEIGRIEGSWAKKVYFAELLGQATLDPQAARQVLLQAGREIDSDFELASLLIDSADKLLLDESARKAYFDAARSIDSDFEMRRVYSSALKRGAVGAPILAGILDASRSIESDFELASLLVQVANLQPLDQTTRAPFFVALGSVGSDFEQRRVLSALAGRRDLPSETVAAMVDSAINLESDFELATLLLQIVKDQGVEGALRVPFFKAVDSIDSAFERGRVLQALGKRPDISEDTVLAILRSVRDISSNHEASQVLLTVAGSHRISGPARDLYIDAAEKLGDYEQGRVLTALVKSERGK